MAWTLGYPNTFGHQINSIRENAINLDLRKLVLMASSIQRPPVLKSHSVMSQRCLRNTCILNFWTCIQRPPLYEGHYEVALAPMAT